MEVRQIMMRGRLIFGNQVLLISEDGKIIAFRSDLPASFEGKNVEITVKEIK